MVYLISPSHWPPKITSSKFKKFLVLGLIYLAQFFYDHVENKALVGCTNLP